MKVVQKGLTEKAIEDREYCDAFEIHINGKQEFAVYDGEHEDNTLGRNFNDCYKVVNLLKMAHEAGKADEPLEIEQIEVDEL